MGDDALRPVPARSGCLKWTCGCLVVAAVLSLAAVGGVGYALSGWTPAGGAWENLPPDTLFALEANGVDALLETAAKDPGALSLASAAVRAYQRFLEDRDIPVDADFPQRVYDSMDGFSSLYTMIFPNYLLLGALGFTPEEMFLIAQPPRWFAWTVGSAVPEGSVEEITDGQGTSFYLAFAGAHAVLALNRDTAQHVVDNWGAKRAPLGKSAGRDAPYAMAALNAANAGQGTDEGGDGAPFLSGGGPDGNLTLQDPFAAPSGAGTPPPAHPSLRYQALVSADEDGWRIAFEAADAAKPLPPAGFAEYVDTAFGEENPQVVLPDDSDMELALRLSSDAMEVLREAVTDAVPPRFGGDWLRNGWLDRAGGMFTLLASRPVAGGDEDGMDGPDGDEPPPYPPLPVASLGWNLSSLHAPVPFANYLGEWVDSLGAPGGVLPESVAGALLSCEIAADRMSGAVSVPPVLANGARPAWAFLTETIPSMGWMATDPSGLPGDSLVPRLAVPGLPEPVGAQAFAAANWDMSRVFIDAVEAVALDRLRQLPDGWFADIPMGKEDFAETLHFVGQLFTAYPGGVVKADVDTGTGEAAGKAFVPFGMSVDIE